MEKERDPLNLRTLPPLTPTVDGWPAVRAALEKRSARRRMARMAAGALAVAATVTLVIGLNVRVPAPAPAPAGEVASQAQPDALEALIALSQQMEAQLRIARSQVGSLPTEALIYRVELEDMVAQVDEELSMNPASRELWSHRVNLLLDLDRLYQNQLRRDYHRMASL